MKTFTTCQQAVKVLFPTKDVGKICQSTSFDPSTFKGAKNWVKLVLFNDLNLKLTLNLETSYSFDDFKFELSDESIFGQAI